MQATSYAEWKYMNGKGEENGVSDSQWINVGPGQ
jgi:hypothetical protein